MSKFDRNRIKDGRGKLCTNKQTDKQTDRHYENNGNLAVNQYWEFPHGYYTSAYPRVDDMTPMETGIVNKTNVVLG